MGIFVAWMRAKAMASGAGVAPKGGSLKRRSAQQGIVIIEYIVMGVAVLAIASAVAADFVILEGALNQLMDDIAAL